MRRRFTDLADVLSRLDDHERRIADLESPRQLSRLTRADRARLSRVLPAVGGAFGSDPFLARDVLDDDAPGLRVVRRGLTARRLGRLLARAADAVIDGYVVQRVGVELHTTLWRVLQVPGVSNPDIPPRDRRGLVQ